MKIKSSLKAGKLVADAVAWFTQTTGLDKLTQKYTAQTGQDCGCEKRHAILDRLFPF